MKGNYKYVILAVICLCGVNAVYCQYQMSPIADGIMDLYGLTQMQYSTLFSAPMAPAIFISLICGLIVDKMGAKKVVFVSLLVAMFSLWGRLFADSYATLYLSMFCTGFAATFVNSTNAKLLGEWFTPKQTGIAVGVYYAMCALGMAVGTGTTAMLPTIKSAYILAAVLASITAVIWLIFMKEQRLATKNKQEESSVFEVLKLVLKKRDILLACAGVMCSYGSYLVISTFLPMILQERGMSQIRAGSSASVVSIGYLLGCLTVPAIAAKIGNIRKIIFVLALVGAVSTISVCIVPLGVALIIVLVLAGYCGGGILPLFMSLPVRVPGIGVEKAGTAGGLLATFQLFGAVVIPSYVVSPLAGNNKMLLLVYGGIICAVVCVLTFFLSNELEIV